ncbi:MAG: type 4a pilus biogenesis protein PilO [Chitinivibrionales bacterium]|nr:type 4a pilus biogenesis protein PilO [Chitinivibrionales bacterium]
MNIDKIVASFKKINFRDRKVQGGLIIILAGLGCVYGWYTYLYAPAQEKHEQLTSEVEQKEKKLHVLVAMKPQLEKIKAEIVAKSILLDSLKSIFPDQKEVPKLIHEITRLSQASEVQATKFNPMEDVQREYYVENRYQLSMWGGYHDFAAFLSRLANLRLIINLSEVKLLTHPSLQQALQESEGEAAPANTIEASFVLTTFSSRR